MAGNVFLARQRVVPIARLTYAQLPMDDPPDMEAPFSEKGLSIENGAGEPFEKISEQMKLRAHSFESYAFISALLFAFSCMALKWDNGDYILNREAQKTLFANNWQAPLDLYEILFLLHMLFMTLACSLSMYSTIVFSLSCVYVQTGLITGHVNGLQQFLRRSQTQRDLAFKAFVLASSLLPCDIILVTFANILQHGHGVFVTLCVVFPGTLVVGVSGMHIAKIIHEASASIFAPPPDTPKTEADSSRLSEAESSNRDAKCQC